MPLWLGGSCLSGTATLSPLNLYQLRRSCSTCSLSELCLPMGLAIGDIQRLEDLVAPRGPVNEGEHLFRIGDPLRVLYAVRGGYFKSYMVHADGREQVLGRIDPVENEALSPMTVGMILGQEHGIPRKLLAPLSIAMDRENPGTR